jgi:transposase
MQAYSLDLRERIIKGYEQGHSRSTLARTFMVSLSSVKGYIERYEKQGHVRPTVQKRMQGKLTEQLRKLLTEQVESHPDYTLAQHAHVWQKRHKMSISESTLSRALRRMGWTRKKKTIGAVERDEAARRAFRKYIQRLNSADVVIIDECGSRVGMIPLYARAPRGSRAFDRAIRNYGQNLTLLASLDINGIQAAMTLEGTVDELAFEAFITQVLLPTLRPGQIVIMDNLSSHKTDKVEQLITNAACQLVFLPAYSPDLSPIEEAFSKLKAGLRRARPQSVPDLIRAIQQAINAISSQDARGWFSHAGFSVQST